MRKLVRFSTPVNAREEEETSDSPTACEERRSEEEEEEERSMFPTPCSSTTIECHTSLSWNAALPQPSVPCTYTK